MLFVIAYPFDWSVYEGVVVFLDLRAAAHIVSDRYATAAPDDFFSTVSKNPLSNY